MLIINFSHPLSKDAKDSLGNNLEEIIVSTQIDFEQNIEIQLNNLVAHLPKDVTYFIIPPALSFAAAYVANKIDDNCEGMIILKRVGVPPTFVIADIVSF